MSYWIITNSRGQEVANIADGTVNTANTSLTLIGKNYAYYGQPQNENYVYLLENFANDTAPSNPVAGQLWFNTSTNTLSVYNAGSSWSTVATTGGGGALGTMSGQNANNVAITGGSITGISPLALTVGGTGSATAAGARTNLGLGTIVTQNSNAIAITGGTITGITDLAIADGGTGASTAAGARTNLGLGTMAVQDSSFITVTGGSITGISPLAIADGGTGASTASVARNNLGLGSIATQNSGTVNITGGTITGITDLAIADGGTGASTAAGARTNLGLGTIAVQNSDNINITGGAITGVTLSANSVSVLGNVTANYVIGNGALLTGLPAGYSNANASTYLASGTNSANIVTTGNISGGNIRTTGIISASGNITTPGYFIGNFVGNVTGNITVPGSNTQVIFNTNGTADATSGLAFNKTSNALSVSGVVSAQGNVIGGNITTAGQISATGNITGGNISGSLITGAGITSLSTISAAGNVIGNYFIGNGSLLTGIASSYGNSNVASLLVSFGSNNINTAGDISCGNLFLVANATISGTGFISGNAIIGGNESVTGNLTVSGNTTVVGNISAGNATAGNLSVSGNITGNTNGFPVGYLNIPQVLLTSNTTAALSDTGKHYYSTLSSNVSLTIPPLSWPVGATITVINRGTGNIIIAQGSGVSVFVGGNSTANNRSLSSYGIATLINVASNTWFINGVGVS